MTPASGAPFRRRRALLWWYGLMAAGGTSFGLLGDRRPLGTDVLAHPFVIYFAAAGAGLVLLRVAIRRPVPELIPERALVVGCLLGAAAFLIGNWMAAHLPLR